MRFVSNLSLHFNLIGKFSKLQLVCIGTVEITKPDFSEMCLNQGSSSPRKGSSEIIHIYQRNI